MSDQPALIVHIIYRLDVGGLENGLVNLINTMSADHYRHAIICLTHATDFRQRIHKPDVNVYELHKSEGKSLRYYFKVYKLLRQLQPDIVHTRNLATIETQLPAWLAGVRFRVHGEHGWDVYDPDGTNKKYQWLRRLLKPLIHHFVPLSLQLERYLTEIIKVKPQQLTRICNGVDADKFYPDSSGRSGIADCPFSGQNQLLIGTVGRMHGVKDQINLVEAFIKLRKDPQHDHARLILVGDGPLRQQAIDRLEQAGLLADAWLPGAREDIDDILRGLDLFILPSSAEGISNTILEAMATVLPVIATNVGGNAELVVDEVTGYIVPASNSDALASAIARYVQNPQLLALHGQAGYQRILEHFSLNAMVNQYLSVYDRHRSKRIT